MPIHEEVLRAARRIASNRRDWTFTPAEVVVALPHLNPRSVRTHVVSRCCVNAPKHHLHRWGYFKRVGRGRYQLLPPYRAKAGSPTEPARPPARLESRSSQVAESYPEYASATIGEPPDVVHALVSRDGEMYVAECVEISAVTQARTLDALIANLREAVGLHLEGRTTASRPLDASPRISVIYEVPLVVHGGGA